MRIFLAAFLTPESARSLLARAPAVPGMRALPHANLHVTLHFLGSVPAERLADVRSLALALPAEETSARVGELTGFPSPERARALVARLEDGDRRLACWHAELTARWPTPESRRFEPHVTLARGRRPVPLTGLPDLAGLELHLASPAAWVSETRPEGARYRRLR